MQFLYKWSEVILYFSLFSFCGWVSECIFCSIKDQKVVNRGFLNGPVCPIYGFGGLIVVYILAPVQENLWLLFLLGMLFTAVLEYLTSYILEKLFHTTWWDYSHLPLNLNGRICLRFALIFGALSVAAVRLLYPPFSRAVALIPLTAQPWLAAVLMAIFIADGIVTTRSILALNGKLAELERIRAEVRQRLELLQEYPEGLQEYLDRFKAVRAEKTAAQRAALENLFSRWEAQKFSRFQHRRLMDAFPRMKSHNYNDQLTEIQAAWQELKVRGKGKNKEIKKNFKK